MAQLEAVGLADAADKYPLELSGGMRKRAALARALVDRPAVALFDEPTTGLDPILLGVIHDLIAGSHARLRFTGVVVSHEIPEIFDIAEQVAMLEDGVIVESGTPEQILTSQNPVVRRFLAGREANGMGPAREHRRRLYALVHDQGADDKEGPGR